MFLCFLWFFCVKCIFECFFLWVAESARRRAVQKEVEAARRVEFLEKQKIDKKMKKRRLRNQRKNQKKWEAAKVAKAKEKAENMKAAALKMEDSALKVVSTQLLQSLLDRKNTTNPSFVVFCVFVSVCDLLLCEKKTSGCRTLPTKDC